MRLDRVVLSTLCLTTFLVSASTLYAQDPPTAVAAQGRPQRPPENLKVLPPIPNLRAEMQKIADSLGVKCDFCHVQGNFPSDERREKLHRAPHDGDGEEHQRDNLRVAQTAGRGFTARRPGDVLHVPSWRTASRFGAARGSEAGELKLEGSFA